MKLFDDVRVLHNEENAATFVASFPRGDVKSIAFVVQDGRSRFCPVRDGFDREQLRRIAASDGARDMGAVDRAIAALS